MEKSDESENKQETAQSSVAGRRAVVREVRYRQSAQFVPILEHLGCSLLVSTYAAGKVVSVGSSEGKLHLGFSNFQQAMGIAPPYIGDETGAGPDETGKRRCTSIAVGGPNAIWFLRDAGSLAPRVEPAGTYDRGFLARESFVTGNIHVHEMGWGADRQLWVVNTLFSCIATLHEDFNFVPRWKPDFISELAPQDRCHLNGMAMRAGRPKYVTALGTTDSPRGWREGKASGGVVIDVDSGEVVGRDFCMPHSPRLYCGKLYVLDSGRGRLVTVDPASGRTTDVAAYPGYGRGLAFCGPFAFIAMSRARERSVFGGVPICEDPGAMRCGLVVIEVQSGKSLAFLEFESGVEELFDVQVIEGSRRTVLCGPFPKEDEQLPVWVVPREDQVDELVVRGGGERVQRKQFG